MRIGRALTHAGGAVLEGGLIAIIIAMLVFGTALAKGPSKPNGGSSTGTLAGPVMVHDTNGNGAANYLDDVTFSVSTTASTKPMVGLRCWQGGTFMYDGYVGYWDGYMFTPYFTLASGYWDPSVTADCTARLFYYDSRGREHVLSTLGFSVAP